MTQLDTLDLTPSDAFAALETAQMVAEAEAKFFETQAAVHINLVDLLARVAIRYGNLVKNPVADHYSAFEHASPWLAVTQDAQRAQLGIDDERSSFKIVARYQDYYDPEAKKIHHVSKITHKPIMISRNEQDHISSIERITLYTGVADRDRLRREFAYADKLGFVANDVTRTFDSQYRQGLYGGTVRHFMGLRLPQTRDGHSIRSRYLDIGSSAFTRMDSLAHILMQEAIVQAAS